MNKKIKASDIKIKVRFKYRDKNLGYNPEDFRKVFVAHINELMIPIANNIGILQFKIIVYFSKEFPTVGIHLYDKKYNRIGFLKINHFVDDSIDINLATFLFERKQVFLQLFIYKVIIDKLDYSRETFIPIKKINNFKNHFVKHLELLDNAKLLNRINGNTLNLDGRDCFFFELCFDVRDNTVWWLTFYSEINKTDFSGESKPREISEFTTAEFIDAMAECRVLFDNSTKEELKKMPFEETFEMLRLLNY